MASRRGSGGLSSAKSQIVHTAVKGCDGEEKQLKSTYEFGFEIGCDQWRSVATDSGWNPDDRASDEQRSTKFKHTERLSGRAKSHLKRWRTQRLRSVVRLDFSTRFTGFRVEFKKWNVDCCWWSTNSVQNRKTNAAAAAEEEKLLINSKRKLFCSQN